MHLIDTELDSFVLRFNDVPSMYVNGIYNRVCKMIGAIRLNTNCQLIENSPSHFSIVVTTQEMISFYEIQSIAVLATGICYQYKHNNDEA